jgi:hypothetical protein
MPQVKYTADGLPYYDATDQQTQPYFAQPTGAMLPAPGNPAQPSEGWNQGVRDTLHGMTIGPVQGAAKALQGGMTWQEAQDFAFGAALGLLPMGRGLRPATQGIRAYHGSPHDFDRFDMSKIGTGEGAQAYGHGLYFAENEAVAKQYRNLLATRGGALTDAASRAQFWTSDLGSPESAIKHLEGVLQQAKSRPKNFDPADLAITQQSIDYLKGGGDLMPKGGKMYEVNINAHPDQFLDWDKPLSKQFPVVQDLARSADLSHLKPGNRTRVMLEKFRAGTEQDHYPATGHTLHNALEDYGMKPRPELSQYLNSQGIPGIKYLDQGSRPINMGLVEQSQRTIAETERLIQKYPGNPELLARREALAAEIEANRPTHNYVVFDDKLISIIKKYGWAAVAPMLGLTAENLPIPKAQAPQFQ